jgi:hypothetical protein
MIAGRFTEPGSVRSTSNLTSSSLGELRSIIAFRLQIRSFSDRRWATIQPGDSMQRRGYDGHRQAAGGDGLDQGLGQSRRAHPSDNAKVPRSLRNNGGFGINAANMTTCWARMEALEHALDRRFRPHNERRHATIGFVAHGPGQSKMPGLVDSPCSKPNTLHPAPNADIHRSIIIGHRSPRMQPFGSTTGAKLERTPQAV